VCFSIETVLTCVTYPDSGQVDIWVTQSNGDPHLDLIGCAFSCEPAIVSELQRLISQVCNGAHS
jgi:hypothetical protein